MTTNPHANTAILLIDPYNDFIHPDGKLYSLLADSLKETDTISHIFDLLKAARAHKIPVYYGLHQPWKTGNFTGWNHMMAIHSSQNESHAFEEGSWGGTIFEGMEPDLDNGDVVVSKHWTSRRVEVKRR